MPNEFMMDAIVKPVLGGEVELGQLFDARTNQLYAGISLWKSTDIAEPRLELNEEHVQDAVYWFSTSVDDARRSSGLDLEGGIGVDLGIVEVNGSAKYLQNEKVHEYEARVNVTCTIARRTRRIPMEVLNNMPYERVLCDDRYTHFVAEVVEGATATLTFITRCESAEQEKTVSGKLAATLRTAVPSLGDVELKWNGDDARIFGSTKISFSGAVAQPIGSIEDAIRVARDLPKSLQQQMNSLRMTLLPLSVLDGSARRLVRAIDENALADTAHALDGGRNVSLALSDVENSRILQRSFPLIRQQVANFSAAFARCLVHFTAEVRSLLPKLKDGSLCTDDHTAHMMQLLTAVKVFELRVKVAHEYLALKRRECNVLQNTIDVLIQDHGFESRLGTEDAVPALIGSGQPRLLLSFGGRKINTQTHRLEKELDTAARDIEQGRMGHDGQDDDGPDSDDGEWFESQAAVAFIRDSCERLQAWRNANPDVAVSFVVGSVDKALLPGGTRKRRTQLGDIILEHNGSLTIVSGLLPGPPSGVALAVDQQTIGVKWAPQTDIERAALAATSVIVRYRPRRNAELDGIDSNVGEHENFKEVRCAGDSISAKLTELPDNTDFEVAVLVDTVVGRSSSSTTKIARTQKLPSPARQLIDFYEANRASLATRARADTFDAAASDARARGRGVANEPLPWERVGGRKSWEAVSENGSTTLFLGFTTAAVRLCSTGHFKGETAVLLVDVAPEFKPEIQGSATTDAENVLVLIFAGPTGHGKTTEINAFISYLLRGDLNDPMRILVVDDRGANQSHSVTKYVTVYRLRPIAPAFAGKTILVCDTPGFGDTAGVQRDRFVTAAMSELFKTISHCNAVVFTCKSNEQRRNTLAPVATYVFQLFHKNVRSCLRTIFTFSDMGTPSAKQTLTSLGWPVDNGFVEVNNSAFRISGADSPRDAKTNQWWQLSMVGQSEVLRMLTRMSAVPTELSAQVTTDRMTLERHCELAEKKIYRTANDAQKLLSNLDALAGAVGAAPGEKVRVTMTDVVTEDVPAGKHTTLCVECNCTCHEICEIGDDSAKANCAAMSEGYCTQCPKKCHWSKHKNARFILKSRERVEMVVPADLIANWNKNNNTLEGALLGAVDEYLALQKGLRDDILQLVLLTEKLKKEALLHNPDALIRYLDSLIAGARAQGASSEQLLALQTAKNTMLLVAEINNKGAGASRDSELLTRVLDKVRAEMARRMQMDARTRAEEESKPCRLYNELLGGLPRELQQHAPPKLDEGRRGRSGAKYPENLKAIVALVEMILKHGAVVSALAVRER